MMNFVSRVLEAEEKFNKPRMVDYILGKRLCSKCAEEMWKKEAKNFKNPEHSCTVLLGICEKCHKGGVVAYLNSKA